MTGCVYDGEMVFAKSDNFLKGVRGEFNGLLLWSRAFLNSILLHFSFA